MLQEAVQRSQMEVPDHLLSPYTSHIIMEDHKHHMNEKGALWEMQVGTPFGGHPSMSDLESPN